MSAVLDKMVNGAVARLTGERTHYAGRGDTLGYEQWLQVAFPHVASKGLSERHHRLWQWFEAIERDVTPLPRIEPWPRGGAKSTTAELGTVRTCIRRVRNFALYICGTQEQADTHVRSIGGFFESIGVERALGRYGHSRGWRRDQLITETGFAVAAFGLDAAARGVKIDEFRPDLIIFDDVDDREDTPKTVRKKERSIRESILPAQAPNAAILFVQNLIHSESVMARLLDDRAEWLLERDVSAIEPAVRNLVVERVEVENGPNRYRIVSGEATWEGQDLEVCEKQINEFGLEAFLRESQHEVEESDGFFFDVSALHMVDELPTDIESVAVTFDLAATEGGGDYTAGAVIGKTKGGKFVVIRVIRGQWESEKVEKQIIMLIAWTMERFKFVKIGLPEDPGQAGKFQSKEYRKVLSGFSRRISFVRRTGSKAVTARGFQKAVNRGDVMMLRDGRPEMPERWTHDFVGELKKFREDGEHLHDDQVDAVVDGYNLLEGKRRLVLTA